MIILVYISNGATDFSCMLNYGAILSQFLPYPKYLFQIKKSQTFFKVSEENVSIFFWIWIFQNFNFSLQLLKSNFHLSLQWSLDISILLCWYFSMLHTVLLFTALLSHSNKELTFEILFSIFSFNENSVLLYGWSNATLALVLLKEGPGNCCRKSKIQDLGILSWNLWKQPVCDKSWQDRRGTQVTSDRVKSSHMTP